MGRFQVKKQDTFIDMTPMSDVMILLLTFFMLTATFTKEEPVAVNVPGSVSEIKIPETNIMTIFVSPAGKVFMVMDSPSRQLMMAEALAENSYFENQPSLQLNPAQLKTFAQVPTFGVPMSVMGQWCDLEPAKRNEYLVKNAAAGIPCDSVNDELKYWVTAARDVCGEDMRIAIKADKTTPYNKIKNVMNSLRSIDESRYNLITTLKSGE